MSDLEKLIAILSGMLAKVGISETFIGIILLFVVACWFLGPRMKPFLDWIDSAVTRREMVRTDLQKVITANEEVFRETMKAFLKERTEDIRVMNGRIDGLSMDLRTMSNKLSECERRHDGCERELRKSDQKIYKLQVALTAAGIPFPGEEM